VVCGVHSAVIRRTVARRNPMTPVTEQQNEIRQLHEGCRSEWALWIGINFSALIKTDVFSTSIIEN
jgi:hypothetical protein